MNRSGYAGFARAGQFSQSLPSGPHFVNQVQVALICFNLTSVWADNEMAFADDWLMTGINFILLFLPRKSI